MKQIPNALREYRQKAGLRQLDVAEKLGFSTTDRISRWEQGLTFPHVVNLFKLSMLYKTTPQDLYGEVLSGISEHLDENKWHKSS